MYAQMELLWYKQTIIKLFFTSVDRDHTPRERMERIDRMARPTYNCYSVTDTKQTGFVIVCGRDE